MRHSITSCQTVRVAGRRTSTRSRVIEPDRTGADRDARDLVAGRYGVELSPGASEIVNGCDGGSVEAGPDATRSGAPQRAQ